MIRLLVGKLLVSCPIYFYLFIYFLQIENSQPLTARLYALLYVKAVAGMTRTEALWMPR